jgi:polysaccharide biosynthesis protein PslH
MSQTGAGPELVRRESRVLFVSNFSPFLATNGAAIRGRQMLRFLESRYQVDVIFEDEESMKVARQPLHLDMGQVATVPRPSLFRRLAAPLSMLPYHHAAMNQREFAITIRGLAGHGGYAFVWMNKSWLYPAIRAALPYTPVFIEQHAAERDVWENLTRNDPRWYVRLYSRWNGKKVLAYERAIYPDLAGAVSISAADAEVTKETYPRVPLIAIPVGLDLGYYRPSAAMPDPHTLLFAGNDATRNTEAVRRFVTRISRHLHAADPAFRLLWIGKVDPARHDFLPHDLVELTGYVEHVQEHFDRGAILIAPFEMGEGVKIKIMEALAMGKLIVSTRIGIRGIGIEGLPFVRLADDDEGFAKAILDFASDPRRGELAAAARRYAVKHFDCQKVLAPLPAFIGRSLEAWRARRMADVA